MIIKRGKVAVVFLAVYAAAILFYIVAELQVLLSCTA